MWLLWSREVKSDGTFMWDKDQKFKLGQLFSKISSKFHHNWDILGSTMTLWSQLGSVPSYAVRKHMLSLSKLGMRLITIKWCLILPWRENCFFYDLKESKESLALYGSFAIIWSQYQYQLKPRAKKSSKSCAICDYDDVKKTKLVSLYGSHRKCEA